MMRYLEKKPEYFEIGETYLKFDFEFIEQNQILIKEAYLKNVENISQDFLKSSEVIKISIEFEKGSLKTKIKIWGLAATLYIGIGQYGSFRQGVREIVQDVKNLSEYVVDNFENEPLIGDERIIRYEKRTGLTGRINNIYKRIDKLERQLNTLSQQEIRIELNSIKQDISNILILLPANTQQQFLEELPNNYQNNLPEPNDRKVNYYLNRYGLKPEDEIEFINA